MTTLLPENYPEEYITGKVNFFGRDFAVTPDVLIPRLETEGLVRRARKILQSKIHQKNEMMKTQNGETEGGKLSESDDNRKYDEQSERVFSPLGTFGTFSHESTENSIGKKSTGLLRSSQGQEPARNIIVIDIGCGSGIIGTSVADLADEVIFLDVSPAALQIAEKNFRTYFPDKKAQFIVSDLLENLPDKIQNPESRILFLTNLPYIKNEDWIHMSEDTIHEPKLALFGGEKTGFELYERLFKQLSALPPSLSGEGLGVRRCIFEFGFDQREVAESIVKQYPEWNYEFFADYAGIERFGEIVF